LNSRDKLLLLSQDSASASEAILPGFINSASFSRENHRLLCGDDDEAGLSDEAGLCPQQENATGPGFLTPLSDRRRLEKRGNMTPKPCRQGHCGLLRKVMR
jgi:hypothetical protein